MSLPGVPRRELFSDALDATPDKAWKIAKGDWEARDGALVGSERKSDMHGAVMRHAQPFHDAVIQYSFKLDGARATTLSLNTAKGHICRVAITPAGFRLTKDDMDHAGPDKAVVLQAVATPITPGDWHTIVVELRGKEMLARLDGKLVALGSHDALVAEKANLGLTVGGASVAFKDLRVWEALPNSGWEETKAKLLTSRPKPASASK
jgi:hypothetical protein